ncbi:MAG: shikimate kinase, partial [Rubricella sp.]
MSEPHDPLDRPVVLIGMMGAGKSSVGRRLARALGTTFSDSDHEVAEAAGRPIPEIFAELGE